MKENEKPPSASTEATPPSTPPNPHQPPVNPTSSPSASPKASTTHRGDLSKMALEALTTIDLTKANLVSAREEMVADTTLSMPTALHQKRKAIADRRNSSMNIVVNSGLAHWLAKRGVLDLT